jgi:hypothetical protein
MIETGKSNIEWERKVPAEKIQDLKDLLNTDNFDENLPTVNIDLVIVVVTVMVSEPRMWLELPIPSCGYRT